ncbi:MAG: hypothetical protein HPY44_01290 [Armatimonadetes bacterium]|nr:hypothetical protein [Armatimonadota bacterium]
MRRLHHCIVTGPVAPVLTLLLVLALGFTDTPAAHAQKISQAISVAVVPFANRSGNPSLLISDKATDAVALALDDSQEYVVTTRADTRREMESLGILRSETGRHSVSTEQMVRLGERLRVEKVASGSVDALSIQKNGQCRVRLTLTLLDIATQEFLEGATADYTTRPIPGWTGDEASAMNEALRSAAEECVRKIQTTRTPRGNVDMVDNSGAIIVNLGARDGIEVGMQLLVVRGVWNAGIEKVVLQKIGVIEVSRVEVNDCVCRSVSGSLPRTADKVYVMYRPSERVAMQARQAKTKQMSRVLIALGLGLGIYAVATGDDNQSAPGVTAFLSQSAPGAEPRIRVEANAGTFPGSAKTHAWLVYRGSWAGFPPLVDDRNFLVAAVPGSKLSNFEDDPSFQAGLEFELTFQYFDRAGDEEDGDVSITYNHLPLTAGQTYFYKLRRIVDPGFVEIPIADTTQAADELEDVDFEIDPPQSLGDASSPAGPITFFYPPQLETPSNGNQTVDPRSGRTTFRWTPSVGADQYKVLIFTNPQATGTAVKESPVLNSTGSTTTMNWVLNMDLQGATEYYWFVAARRSGETPARVRSNGFTGWLLSEPFRFTTAVLPPSGPSSSVDGGKPRPTDRGGIFGEMPTRPK